MNVVPGYGGVSQREYARQRGVSHRAVQKAIASGRIATLPGGKLDPEAADRDWDRNTAAPKPSAKPKAAASQPPTSQVGPDSPRGGAPGPVPQAPGPPEPQGVSYAASRAVRETYLARMARLDFEERQGRLVELEEVKRVCFEAARRSRDMLRAIPDRVAPLLAGTHDVHECQQILREEVQRACEGLFEIFKPS